MIRRPPPPGRYRYHVVLDTQNAALCDKYVGRYREERAHGTRFVTFTHPTTQPSTDLNVPGVFFFCTAGYGGGGDAILDTNHPLWLPRVGTPFDKAQVLATLRI